jgi:hypothetical protein
MVGVWDVAIAPTMEAMGDPDKPAQVEARHDR